MNRREFTTALGVALAGAAVPDLAAQNTKTRKLRCGHTGITWGFRPEDAERAIADVASLGYHGYESFGNVLEAWEAKGGLDKLLQNAKLPLRSAYCPVNLTDPAARKDEVAKLVRWGQLIKKCGGSVAVIGPNNVKRADYSPRTRPASSRRSMTCAGRSTGSASSACCTSTRAPAWRRATRPTR